LLQSALTCGKMEVVHYSIAYSFCWRVSSTSVRSFPFIECLGGDWRYGGDRI